MKKSPILILFILLTGCASNHHYAGKVTDCNGIPIRSIEVNAWKNKLMPFHLPEKLKTTLTDNKGSFKFETKKRVSFFTYTGMILLINNHPSKSENKCNKSKLEFYYLT